MKLVETMLTNAGISPDPDIENSLVVDIEPEGGSNIMRYTVRVVTSMHSYTAASNKSEWAAVEKIIYKAKR